MEKNSSGTAQVITCGCCGKGIHDNKEENVHFGMVPYPDDVGFGMCKECGGDDSITDKEAAEDEEAFKKKLGWGGQMFFEHRFDIARKALSPEKQEHWDTLPYRKKVAFIAKAVENGWMI